MARGGSDTWSFHCSACGKCCNSAPQMSVPELLHHQRRFIGCLAIRRVPRIHPGDRLGSRETPWIASEPDARAAALLSDTLLQRLPAGGTTGDIFLATHAYGDPSSQVCPALGPDTRCLVHEEGKPGACTAVPLDPMLPDRLQHVVLSERSAEAAFFGAQCIAAGEAAGRATVTLRLAVVDSGANDAIRRRRRDLATEKRVWGDRVFQMLRGDLFDPADRLAAVPVNGFLVMSIAPVLIVLASTSPRCRARCAEYAAAQIELVSENLRNPPGDGAGWGSASLQELAGFLRAYRAILSALERGATGPPLAEARQVEAWLGLEDLSEGRHCDNHALF